MGGMAGMGGGEDLGSTGMGGGLGSNRSTGGTSRTTGGTRGGGLGGGTDYGTTGRETGGYGESESDYGREGGGGSRDRER
jgi:hypothetical protein